MWLPDGPGIEDPLGQPRIRHIKGVPSGVRRPARASCEPAMVFMAAMSVCAGLGDFIMQQAWDSEMHLASSGPSLWMVLTSSEWQRARIAHTVNARCVWHMHIPSNTVSYAWYVALSVDTSMPGALGSWAEPNINTIKSKARGLARKHVRNSTTCVIDGVKVCCVHGTPHHRSIRAGLGLWGLRAGQ